MLTRLFIENFALIERVEVEFGPGLNVVTGETGAGKSLLVDALEFVLGGATDRSLVRVGADGASVEAVIRITSPAPALRAALTATSRGGAAARRGSTCAPSMPHLGSPARGTPNPERTARGRRR